MKKVKDALALVLTARAFRRRTKSENEEKSTSDVDSQQSLRPYRAHNVSKREVEIGISYDDDESCDDITINKYSSFDSKRMGKDFGLVGRGSLRSGRPMGRKGKMKKSKPNASRLMKRSDTRDEDAAEFRQVDKEEEEREGNNDLIGRLVHREIADRKCREDAEKDWNVDSLHNEAEHSNEKSTNEKLRRRTLPRFLKKKEKVIVQVASKEECTSTRSGANLWPYSENDDAGFEVSVREKNFQKLFELGRKRWSKALGVGKEKKKLDSSKILQEIASLMLHAVPGLAIPTIARNEIEIASKRKDPKADSKSAKTAEDHVLVTTVTHRKRISF